jgi:hypothetical protein
MIRVLPVARRGALKARVAAAEQLYGALPRPAELRARCSAQDQDLVGGRGMRPGPLINPTAATKASLGSLARRWQQLQAKLTSSTASSRNWPCGRAHPGRPARGRVDTAGQLLVTAGDNPQRLPGEAAFAHLCGVSRSRRPRAAPTATG